MNIRLPDHLVNWEHLPAAIWYRETNDERERERNKEMTCQLGTSAGQRIALAQSKLRILQSIARKKMVEASGIIKWAKIPKSLPTPFFYVAGVPFLLPQFLLFGPSITRTLTRLELKVKSKLRYSGIPNRGLGQLGNSLLYVSYQHSCLISLQPWDKGI